MEEGLFNNFTPESIGAIKNLFEIAKITNGFLAKEIVPQVLKQPSESTHPIVNLLETIPKCKISIDLYLNGYNSLNNYLSENTSSYSTESYNQFFDLYFLAILYIQPNSQLHEALENIRFLFEEYHTLCLKISNIKKQKRLKRKLSEFNFRFENCYNIVHKEVYPLLVEGTK